METISMFTGCVEYLFEVNKFKFVRVTLFLEGLQGLCLMFGDITKYQTKTF